MTSIPPLPKDVEELLDLERQDLPLPPAVHSRVKQRLHASIAVGLTPEGRGLDLRPPSSWGLWHTVVSTGLAVVVGGGLVVLQTRAPVSAPVPVPVVALAPVPPPPVPLVEAPVAEARVEEPAPVVPLRVIKPVRRPVVPPAAVVAPEPVVAAPAVEKPQDNMEAEQHLLELARRALQDGRAGEAAQALEQHGRAFPSGRLTEERQALRVVTLARQGHREEAVEAAAAFRVAYRRSLFLPVVEAALAP